MYFNNKRYRVFVSNRQGSRKINAVESFKCASDAIGEIYHGMNLFSITRGQWSMIDAILHCLDCVGVSKISIWTWTVAEYEVQCINRLMADKKISDGLLIIDRGALVKNRSIIMDWKKCFGNESVRYVRNHAKISTIESESGHRLLLRGSMNLNFNARFEQFDLSEGGEPFQLVRDIEMEFPVLSESCTANEAYSASKVSSAFSSDQLSLFTGCKVWAK